jgi:hypothetical protein
MVYRAASLQYTFHMVLQYRAALVYSIPFTWSIEQLVFRKPFTWSIEQLVYSIPFTWSIEQLVFRKPFTWSIEQPSSTVYLSHGL